jgi:hypothetical protein
MPMALLAGIDAIEAVVVVVMARRRPLDTNERSAADAGPFERAAAFGAEGDDVGDHLAPPIRNAAR